MEKKFKETSIPEDYSKALAAKTLLFGSPHVFKIATVLFDAVSRALASVSNKTVPKAVAFRNLDHSFLAGAKVKYVSNDDDPSNPSAGRWDYIWTTDEKDLEGADVIEASTNSILLSFFTSSAQNLFGMRFQGAELIIIMMNLMLEFIIGWTKENTTDAETATLTLDGVFKSVGCVEDGKRVVAIIPDGAMKVLIKNDEALQD